MNLKTIANLPPHVTIEWLLQRCTECPDCGEMTLWPTTERNKGRPPTVDLHPKDGPRQKWFVRRIVWGLQHPAMPLPDGIFKVISSRCKNMHCINPKLVYLATKKKAFEQASARGSWKGPETRLTAIRSAARRVKLSDEAVLDIISGGGTPAEAAARNGCSEAYARMLRAGLWRRTVTAPANPFAGLLR